MNKVQEMLFIIAESPLHAGSGSELGVVDLPIQRERYTGLPKIESSGIKGSMREAFESISKSADSCGLNKEYVEIIFGPEGSELYAGAMTVTDARLLLFPVKSLRGIFAWITSPMLLWRFKRDLELMGMVDGTPFKDLTHDTFSKDFFYVPPESEVVINSRGKKYVVLEEYSKAVNEEETLKKYVRKVAEWFAENIFPADSVYKFWRDKIRTSLVIVDDDTLRYFVEHSTEIITRIKIDNQTGTVARGALWTEEYLPQDTILYSLLMFADSRKKKSDSGTEDSSNGGNYEIVEAKSIYEKFGKCMPKIIQIGGNQTVGKGLVRLNLLKGVKNDGQQ